MTSEEEITVECPFIRATRIDDCLHQFGDLFFVVLNNANRSHCEEDHLTPAWIVQVLFDEGLSILAQLHCSGGEIFFKGEMQKTVAFLASLY